MFLSAFFFALKNFHRIVRHIRFSQSRFIPHISIPFSVRIGITVPGPAAYELTVLVISSKCGREVEGLILFHMRPNLLRTFRRIPVISGSGLAPAAVERHRQCHRCPGGQSGVRVPSI